MRSDATPPTFRALLIGIDCYLPNKLPDGSYYPHLGGCVNDVRRIREILRNKFNVKDADVTTLTASGHGSKPTEPAAQWPTYSNIIAALKRLCEVSRAGDTVLIHYSGHGGRVRTLFPRIKGADGLDEGLVPTDVGNGTHVRDIELSYLIKSMVKKGLIVTAVIDACHSGGMARGEGYAVRGISVPDLREPPAASEAAPLEELEKEAAVAPISGPGNKDLSAASGWLRQTTGYVLIAACRAAELANETSFDGGTSGALTYALSQELRALRPGVTYAMLADRLIAAVHGRYARQTPSIEGERDRLIFGAERLASPPAINVLGVDASRERIRVLGGQSGGLAAGAQLLVYRNGTLEASEDRRIALAELTEVGSVESWAAVKKRFGNQPVQPGDQAVLIQSTAVALQRAVRLLVPPSRYAVIAAEMAKNGGGFLREAAKGEAADFQVIVDKEGLDEIQDGAGNALGFITPKLAGSAPGADQKLVQRLVHLAKYRNVQALQNRDERSRLTHKLQLELIGWQADYDKELDGPQGIKPKPFDDPANPTVPHGAWFFLKIKNTLAKNERDADDLSRILNVALLALGPRWQIDQEWPTGASFWALQPGTEEIVPLQATVPDGADRCVDILKVIGATDTTSFDWLTLPKLDEKPKKRSLEGAKNGLEELFVALAGTAPSSRTVESAATAPDGWTVAQLEIATKRA